MRTSMANADKQLTVQIAKMAQIVKPAQIIHAGSLESVRMTLRFAEIRRFLRASCWPRSVACMVS